MNNLSWGPEDGQRLKNLRVQSGTDAFVFARNNTLSLAQIQELEEGRGNSFYNPQIKRSTGIKLLRKLGYEFPPEEPPEIQTEELDISAPAALLPGPTTAPLFAMPSTPLAANPHLGFLAKPGFWALNAGVMLIALLWLQIGPWGPNNPTPSAQVGQVGQVGQSIPSKSNVLFVPPSPSSSSQELPVAKSTPTATATDAMPAAPTKQTSALAQAAEPTKASAPALACDWQHPDPRQSHTPGDPLKPGNYVYIEAQSDTELCVLDSQNQKTRLKLAAGTVKSVYGAAPFLVHAQQWQDIRLFFQGRRVNEALDGIQHLVLNQQVF